MNGISVWQILFLFVVFLFWILPWVLALMSNKVKGMHKIIWFIMSFFISWLGYLVYYFVVVKELPRNNR